MKIATWNINGVKARIDNLCQWLKDSAPDIVCLQEIKTVDEGFPRLEIEALGYHVETHGQKGFNGVAILSRQKPDEVTRGLPGDASDEQARFIEAVFSLLTLEHQRIPPTINYDVPDPAIPFDVVPNKARDARVTAVMSNSFGFGGQNASLVLTREPV